MTLSNNADGTHHFILGTFRHPYLYSFSFSPSKRRLTLDATTRAHSGHSWLHISPDKRNLYATAWTQPPTLAAYSLSLSPSITNTPSPNGYAHETAENEHKRMSMHPVPTLLNTVPSDFTSGYVTLSPSSPTSPPTALFSTSGPQGDVFPLDTTTGAFKTRRAVQSVWFVDVTIRDGLGSELDFGGLRHGGHSADLSPDGTKLYIADIGNNCTWTYLLLPPPTFNTPAAPHTSPLPSPPTFHFPVLKLHAKTPAHTPAAGPRHSWPHPNGRVVYVVNEHSGMVDVFEYGDSGELEWRQEGNVLPGGMECSHYWADEVRLSNTSLTLFASTRGLTPSTKGYLASFGVLPSGLLLSPREASTEEIKASYIWETKTSGGWANAIAICPTSPSSAPAADATNEEVDPIYLSLTDSEQGFVQIVEWTRAGGFSIVDECLLRAPVDELGVKEEENVIGASCAVWYD